MIAALDQPFLRYVLELAMIVPASILCLLPLHRNFAAPRVLVILAALLEEALVIFFGARTGMQQNLPSILILAVSIILFFPSLMLTVQTSLSKQIFCFGNAIMFCIYANLITTVISYSWEQDDMLTFSPRSSLLCLFLAFVLCGLFFRTLRTKLPDLFAEHQLDPLWLYGIPIEVLISLMLLWYSQSPTFLANTEEQRIRALVTLGFFPIALLLLYQMLWWFSRRLHEEANLAQENSILRMESKRFASMRRYLDETRTLRHDFRQHVRVLTGLARSGNLEEMTEYLESLEDMPAVLVRYCANPTVDALAAHYALLAENQATQIDWALELPDDLNMRASDFCAVLGNLVENALQAVEKLPEDQRKIQVVARMLSDQMLGLTVENPYVGKIRLRSDGLPAVRRRSHGIGLRSVAATVRKYDGTLDLDTSDGVFRISVLMYPHMPPAKPDAKTAAAAIPEAPIPAEAPEPAPAEAWQTGQKE